jgi:nucleoid-associated protein YgaU
MWSEESFKRYLKSLRHLETWVLAITFFVVVFALGALTTAFVFRPLGSSYVSSSFWSQTPESPELLPSGQDKKTEEQTYAVQPGDSLWRVAERKLGSGAEYARLAAYNGLDQEAQLEIGQELRLPNERLEVETQEKPTSPKYHLVQQGESLWSISQELPHHNWVQLYQLNRQVVGRNPHLIYPGTKLRLQ